MWFAFTFGGHMQSVHPDAAICRRPGVARHGQPEHIIQFLGRRVHNKAWYRMGKFIQFFPMTCGLTEGSLISTRCATLPMLWAPSNWQPHKPARCDFSLPFHVLLEPTALRTPSLKGFHDRPVLDHYPCSYHKTPCHPHLSFTHLHATAAHLPLSTHPCQSNPHPQPLRLPPTHSLP